MKFEQAFEAFMSSQIMEETNNRRRERLERGLGYAEIEFLRSVWYPAAGNFNHLYPEWEVKDFSNSYRYLDFAYMPGQVKGAIEIQGYGSHARDMEIWRFKDLCIRHCYLALDGWVVMPLAFPSITESPKQCQQLILSFIGKFISTHVPVSLSWVENETIRFARGLLRPFPPSELSAHLKVSTKYARIILHRLCDMQLLVVTKGQERARMYQLNLAV
ncbi:transcriptional regulator [Paenibacillus sp. HWE-109]|uniref:transcriptional regulator n=1 Tax=Paenibacillus sp. HWE-109 TaxID=1306526 RepID=UPI001EDDBB37|nr:transcriptional regulator [Paenibacillus sp. HWE-109]UKS28831.1 transcriptional regulator [Paenibacillus sp. HWE-109]